MNEAIVVGSIQPQVERVGPTLAALYCEYVGGEPLAWTCLALNKPLPTGIGPLQHKKCPLRELRTKACEVKEK